MSKFFIWLSWLHDLGGTYEYVGDPPTDPTKAPAKTGRRDPDRKPRTYELNKIKYARTPKGVIMHWQEWMYGREGFNAW